ncbi:MAG TPA: ABC transporter substrate-binding protein [Candidatus Wallbacteria bacterium]|nr:ABC transporter substrate-binding protein [Candidatus Wallbacteria bacterium]
MNFIIKIKKAWFKKSFSGVINLCLALLIMSLFSAQPVWIYPGCEVLFAAEKEKPMPEPYQGLDFSSELKGTPEKIIPLFPQSLGIVYLFNVQRNVIGMPMSKIKISVHKGGFFSQIDRAVMLKKDIGYPGMPNIETLIGLKPDLIITPSGFHMKANQFFDKLKIPQFRMHGTFSKTEDWLVAVENFGKILNKEEMSKKYIDYFNLKFNMVRDRIKNANSANAIKVAHLVKAGDKYIAYGQKSSFVKSFLKDIGCDVLGYSNKDAAETPLSQEELLKFDPDFIFIESITHATGKVEVELKEGYWKKLAAYKNGRIYFVPVDDESCFLTGWYFNLAAPLGVLWTAKTIYPEQFKDVNLDDEANKFYKDFMNVDREKMVAANKDIEKGAEK